MRIALLAALLLLPGCVGASRESEGSLERETILAESYQLTAAEIQASGGAQGLGVEQDNCVDVVSSGPSRVLSVHANVSWVPTAPTNERLFLEIDPPEGDDVEVEGVAPLAASARDLPVAGEERVTIYVGAPRGSGIVVGQRFQLDLTVRANGEVRAYTLSCTVAG